MSRDRLSILFLCTGNSARSIMAEAIARGRFGDRLDAASAGARPTGAVNPLALETLAGNGIDTGGLRSKSWHEVAGRRYDLVVTLCDSAAAEPCPALPGGPPAAHWSLPDPPAAAEPRRAFAEVYEALLEAIERLAGDGETLDDRCAAATAAVEKRFGPADTSPR